MLIHNPILPGFHPDPSVVRVGNTYYIANSTFEWFPGVSIHQSVNLRDWELITCPLSTMSMLDLRGVLNGGGVWAPCLSYHEGVYYLVFSVVRTDEERMQDTANYITTAVNIMGPWSKPVYLNSIGFDASLFHDETDDTAWLVQMRWDFQPGHDLFRGIYMRQFDRDTLRLSGKTYCIFHGTDRGFTEGPHLYRRGRYYYLMTAEGGTRDTHCITMARSEHREGHYTVDPENPILSAYEEPSCPIQYAGHGDLFEDGRGHWYVAHLGVRKYLTGGYSVMGRETFLQSGHWTQDGWFRLDAGRLPQETIEVNDPCGADRQQDFYREYRFQENAGGLDLHFSTLRIPLDEKSMSLTERPGYLRLKGRESILSKHGQVMTALRIADIHFTAETELLFEPEHYQQMAGLTLFYNTANFYYCFVSYEEGIGKHLQVMIRNNHQTSYLCEKPISLENGLPIRISVHFSPEGIQFLYAQGETEYQPVHAASGYLPIKILSDEYATESGELGFTGGFIGLCCQDLSGEKKPADFRYLIICP